MRRSQSYGKIAYNNAGRKENLVEIEWELTEESRFSMSGSIWNRNHSDIIAGGQCLEEIAKLLPHNKDVQRKVEIWRTWHLNDMKADCVHQRQQGWPLEKSINLFRFQLDSGVSGLRSKIENNAIHGLKYGQIVSSGWLIPLNEEEKRLLNLPFFLEVYSYDTAIPTPEDYEPDRFRSSPERKMLGWVRAEDHPDGLLGKPCSVCGYKYGTAWLKEELPPEIVAEIKSWGLKKEVAV